MLKGHAFEQLFCEKIWSVNQKAIPLHPLSRTNAISQMNKLKLASVLSWRAVELNERYLKLTPMRSRFEGAVKKEFFEKDLHKTEK